MGSLSDIEKIFLVLAILYLIESVFWVRRGTVAFSSLAGRYIGTGQCISLISNELGRVVVCGPLPNDVSFIANPIPISIGTDGVLGYLIGSPTEVQRLTQTHRFCDWQQLLKANAFENQVVVEGEVLCTVQSHYAARSISSKLAELAKSPESKRLNGIEEWASSELDGEETFARIKQWRSQTRNLRRSIDAFFLWIFPIGMTYYSGILPGSHHPFFLVGYLLVFFALWWWIVWRLYWDHLILFPNNRRGRIKSVLTSLVSPGAALRSSDHLARELFTFIHPMTLAANLLPTTMLNEYARRIWRDLEYPLYPVVPEEIESVGLAVATEHHSRTKRLVQTLLKAQGLHTDNLNSTPPCFEPSSLAYCPRCLREYTLSDALCTACGERPTLPIGIQPSGESFLTE